MIGSLIPPIAIFKQVGFYIKLAFLLAVVAGVWFAYNRYTNTIIENEKIKENVKLLEDKINFQERQIQSIEFDAVLNATLRDALSKKIDGYAREQQKLRNTFEKKNRVTNEVRDIGKLADAKPKLLEKIVNAGSDDFKRCIEIASGAPLTKEEIDAKKPSQVNSSCPELANPNYIR